MTKYNISQAAKAVGVSRKTMQRHIQKGKVSYNPSEDGAKWIDASELIRAYGNIKEPVSPDPLGQDGLMSRRDPPIDTALLKQENEFLKKQIEGLEADKEEGLQREKELRETLNRQTKFLEYKPNNEENQQVQPQNPKALTWLNATLIGCGAAGTGFGIILAFVTWVLPHLR